MSSPGGSRRSPRAAAKSAATALRSLRQAILSSLGPAARDELREGSDIDLLVEFDGPATFDGYFGLKDYLEALFGRTVDLVTEQGLKPRARRSVERDLVGVA